MKVKTQVLQEMLTKAVKGSVPNKMLPLTSLIGVKSAGNKFELITTDGSNYLYVIGEQEDSDTLDISVDIEKFSKLVAKFSTEFTELEVDDGVLKISGNGQYKIGLPLDEDNGVVKYTDPVSKLEFKYPPIVVSTEDIKSVLQFNKPALAVSSDESNCYTNYYTSGDSVVSTDSFKLCGNKVSLGANTPLLISASTMELLNNISDETCNMRIVNNTVCFFSSDITVYSVSPDGVEKYSNTVNKIQKIIDTDLTSNCRVSKNSLISLLERISLFVGPYDKNIVSLQFGTTGLVVSSKDESAIDELEYKEAQNVQPFDCLLDISMLLSLIKSQTSDYLNIYFGESSSRVIKLVDGDVSQVLALATQ